MGNRLISEWGLGNEEHKLEARNPKQTRMTEIQNTMNELVQRGSVDLGFVSCFEIRISNFILREEAER